MYILYSITRRARAPTPVRSRVRWTRDMSGRKHLVSEADPTGWGELRRRTGIRDEPWLHALFVLLFRTCYRTKGSNPSTLTGCAGSVAVTMGLWWTGRGCRGIGEEGGGGGRRRYCRRTRKKDLRLKSLQDKVLKKDHGVLSYYTKILYNILDVWGRAVFRTWK